MHTNTMSSNTQMTKNSAILLVMRNRIYKVGPYYWVSSSMRIVLNHRPVLTVAIRTS